MSIAIIKTVEQKQQRAIHGVLRGLNALPKTTVAIEWGPNDVLNITIKNEQVYVPDFRLEWCSVKQHYRVYIHVAHTNYNKTNSGYCICTIGSSLAAMGFGVLYSFLHKHRANNKEAAFAAQ